MFLSYKVESFFSHNFKLRYKMVQYEESFELFMITRSFDKLYLKSDLYMSPKIYGNFRKY